MCIIVGVQESGLPVFFCQQKGRCYGKGSIASPLLCCLVVYAWGGSGAFTSDWKCVRRWLSSQKGLVRDCPQRHRVISSSVISKGLPSLSSKISPFAFWM